MIRGIRRIRLVGCVWLAGFLLSFAGSSFISGIALAADPRVVFELTDEPGAWFRNAAGPVVYNGWVQNLPQRWKDQLTPAQRDPPR